MTARLARLLGRRKAGAHIIPVDDLEDRFHVAGPHVLVLQIVRVLPHINAQQRHQAGGRLQRILVGARRHLQRLRLRIVAQPAPAGALHAHRAGDQLLLERLEAAEVGVDLGAQVGADLGAVRRQVLEEDLVVEVAAAVEAQRILQPDDLGGVVLLQGLLQLDLGRIVVGHVGRVVLAVVQLVLAIECMH